MAAPVPVSPGLETDQEGKVMTAFLLVASGFIFMTLVTFTQIGQTLIEAGLSRRFCSNYVLVKNGLMLSVGIIMWWLTGYAFSFVRVDVFIGEADYAGDQWGTSLAFARATAFGFIGIYVLFIINGAVIERVNFIVYMVTTVFLMGFVWPAVVAWVWGHGWLRKILLEQFIDPGGAAVIHLFAGGFALPALLITKRKYSTLPPETRNRPPLDLKPSSTALVAFGVLFEMIGIVYINALQAPDVIGAGLAFFNTWLSGGISSVIALFFATLGSRRVEDYYLASFKGFIAGMVGVAGFAMDTMTWEALVQGVIVGVLFSIFSYVSRALDDRALVIPAHLIAGFAGCFGTAFWDNENGIYHHGHGDQIGLQMIGIVCILFWAFAWGCLIYGISSVVKCLTVSDEVKEEGLEMADLGMDGYKLPQTYGAT